jgi:hypothetical protein
MWVATQDLPRSTAHRRGERLERPFAHLYETGAMRRVHLRGHRNILKRLVIHTAGFSLGVLMRRLIGVGTPRSLHGRLLPTLGVLFALIRGLCQWISRDWPTPRLTSARKAVLTVQYDLTHNCAREMAFTTGC